VALPAFAAAERNTVVAHRAAAPLVLTAGPPAVLQSIDVYWSPGPQQQTRRSGMQRSVDGTDRQTDGRTDAVPLHRPCSAYTMRAVPMISCSLLLPVFATPQSKAVMLPNPNPNGVLSLKSQFLFQREQMLFLKYWENCTYSGILQCTVLSRLPTVRYIL